MAARMEHRPLRSYNSNLSMLSTSAASSSDGFPPSHEHPEMHPLPMHGAGVHHAPSLRTAQSKPSGSGFGFGFGFGLRSTTLDSSTSSVSVSSSTGSPSESPVSGSPKVVMRGYMLVKKGMLKGYEKRFYFLVARAPELYSFRDERAFEQWLAAELPVRSPQTINRDDSVYPMRLCNILRAEKTTDASAFDRGVTVITGDEQRVTSLKFLAPSVEQSNAWLQALQHVQLTRRVRSDSSTSTSSSTHHRTFVHTTAPPPPPQAALRVVDSITAWNPRARPVRDPEFSDSRSQITSPMINNSNHHQPDFSLSGLGAHRNSESSESQHSGGTNNPLARSAASANSSSTTSTGTTTGTHTPANVVLFVPAAGSAISLSDAKLAEAKKELEQLTAQGAKAPVRTGLEPTAKTQTTWRYGPPQYVLDDLEYIKGKTRDHDATPLESYVETCCQTFVMEATHKAHYSEWTSVHQDYFFIQANDGDEVGGRLLQEKDFFGLLCLREAHVDMELREGEESKDTRAVLAEAFTSGFPMEVLDVYTQPPQCHFAWRHWGRFTGRYKGVRGSGELVQLRGFGQLTIDSGRLISLRLYFKLQDVFDQLQKCIANVAPVRQPRPQRREPAPAAPPAPTPVAPPARRAPAPVVVSSPQTPEKQGEEDRISADLARSVHVSTRPPSAREPAPSRSQLYQRFMPQAPGA